MKTMLALIMALALLGGARAGAASGEGAASTDANQVVVRVNDTKITLGEIESRLGLLAPAVRIRIRENKKQFLEGLVQSELLYQEAMRQQVGRSPAILEKVERFRRRLVIEQFLKMDVAAVSESEYRDFFLANKEMFRRKESVTLAHIVLKTEKEAWEAVTELRGGASFADVARRRSIFESTREAGGMMGTAERGALEKAIEDAAFMLPIGRPSDPIRTTQGWQIIRVIERMGAEDAKYEDVKDDVRLVHAEVRRRERYEALLESLRKKAKVEIHADRFK